MSSPPPAAPRPALRTTTTFSIKSQSGPTSPGYPSALSPTSSVSDNGGISPSSPAETHFFGAIASKLRVSRSRSRSRSGVGRRNRSKSPYQLPPEQLPSASAVAGPSSPTYTSSRSQRPRHVSTPSQSSTASAPQASRPSMQNNRRSTNGSDMWRGRQTNSWLFNDFSVTESCKGLLHMGKNPRS